MRLKNGTDRCEMFDRYTLLGFICGLVFTFIVYDVATRRKALSQLDSIVQRSRLDSATNRKPRILCWIPTIPQNYENKTRAVQETWGPDCDVTIFFSEYPDVNIPVVGLGVPESRDNLAQKSLAALSYIYTNYYDKADWFLKADDDSYVIVNNLRHFLLSKDPDAPFYYGSTFNVKLATYNSGGAGYVFGRRTLKVLAENSDYLYQCADYGPEDLRIGQCLRTLGISPGDSTDEEGLEVFHWSDAFVFTQGASNDNLPRWVQIYQSFWGQQNIGSKFSATFHYVRPTQMRLLHDVLNNMTVHGYTKDKYSVSFKN